MITVEQKPQFVYVTYIAATPQQVWDALTDAEFSKQYWFGSSIHSTWETGSPIGLRNADGVETHDGVVLAAEPPHLLSYSFHDYANPQHAGETASRVTFTIEPSGESVKLTLVHDQFPEGSTVLPAISQGWPMILAGLKTLLENGRALKFGEMTACKA